MTSPAVRHVALTRPERILYRGLRAVLVAFARTWMRLRVDGTDKVPADRAFILAPVHRSNIDFLVVLACSPRRMRYLAKDSLWTPVTSRLFTALGGIPVARGSADRDALRACIEVVEAGEPLVIFPEGTRQTGPEVQPLFDGPAFVQSRTGAPIVPVGIGGSERVMPKGSKMIWPRPVTIVIGDPLEAPTFEGPKARRSSVRAQTAALKPVLQELFDEARRRVRSR